MDEVECGYRRNDTTKGELEALRPDPQKSGKNNEEDRETKSLMKKVFEATTKGDITQLEALRPEWSGKKLSEDFLDKHGKTALMNALMNLKDEKNDTIEVLLNIAEQTEDLPKLINAAFTSSDLKGQTALHIAIERRSFEYVKLLVEKGAHVKTETLVKKNFYYAELPLSLAACTLQPEIVSFLMEKGAKASDQDSRGNTVLHSLVYISDDKHKSTKLISNMYDKILIDDFKLKPNGKKNNTLELIENKDGLTPLKLAADLGKSGMLKHMLNREFMDEETRPLSRKFTQWVYGPLQCLFYDMSDVDTSYHNSVLEILVLRSGKLNQLELLQIEPLHSFIEHKWQRFGRGIFWVNFGFYLIYLAILNLMAVYRKDGESPFPIENTPGDILRCFGWIICVYGAVRMMFSSITIYWRRHPGKKGQLKGSLKEQLKKLFKEQLKGPLKELFKGLFDKDSLNINGYFDPLFFLQGTFFLVSVVLYLCKNENFIEMFLLSLVLAWVNGLYFTRIYKKLGIYVVMMQKMILNDLRQFLCVYSVLIFGFSFAVVTLINYSPTVHNTTQSSLGPEISSDVDPSEHKTLGFHSFRFTLMEMFKFTIGMGNLEFTEDIENIEVFYTLLVGYIVVTYILMLNMLIAMMGNTVENTSEEIERIWNLQKTFTTLDMEKEHDFKCFINSFLNRDVLEKLSENDEEVKYFRLCEKRWDEWRSDVNEKVQDHEEKKNCCICHRQRTSTTEFEDQRDHCTNLEE